MGTRRKVDFGGNIGINEFCWVEKRNPTYVLKLPAQLEKLRNNESISRLSMSIAYKLQSLSSQTSARGKIADTREYNEVTNRSGSNKKH